jgi:hypothetical protein
MNADPQHGNDNDPFYAEVYIGNLNETYHAKVQLASGCFSCEGVIDDENGTFHAKVSCNETET